MKILSGIFCILLISITAGCGKNNNNKTSDENFMLHSLKWGETWETIKDDPQLSSYSVLRDDGRSLAIEIEGTELLGVNGKTRLMFDNNTSPSSGLVSAYFLYGDQDENTLITECEKVFGERTDSYTDKNGVENPIQPSGWYSPETVESSLTDEERDKYLELSGDIEQSRLDALLRQPLVIITVDEDNNIISFSGNSAAVINNLTKGNY